MLAAPEEVMLHLDEGMVHTWLDGELSPAEGAAIESHAAQCAMCAALIAEARGLMAASTRILGALDDVPAGVIPIAMGHTPAATSHSAEAPAREPQRLTLEIGRGTGASESPLRRGARRPLYRQPRFAAAAALLVVAFGTWTVGRRMSPEGAGVSPRAITQASEPNLSDMMDSAALDRAASPAGGPLSAPPATLALQQSVATRRAKASANSVATTGAEPADKLPSAPAATNLAVADERRRDAPARRAELGAAAASLPSPVPTGVASRAPDSARSGASRPPAAPESKRLAVSADSLVAKEQDRVAGEVRTQNQGARQAAAAVRSLLLQDVVVTGASATVTKTTMTASACYDLGRSSGAIEQHVPPRVQLLETRGPTTGERLWKQVRVLGEDPGTGEWFWWRRPDGALLLARLQGAAVRYEVAVTGPLAQEVRAYAQPCP